MMTTSMSVYVAQLEDRLAKRPRLVAAGFVGGVIVGMVSTGILTMEPVWVDDMTAACIAGQRPFGG